MGEPLTATLVAAGYTALLIVLPLILWQAYAFVLPAFSPTERRVAFPLMLMVPFLFYAGVVFAYFLVLPAAVDFLQNFNDDNYDVLLQARDYNKFAVMVMGVMGLLFQLPVVILAITRMGIVTPQQLRKQRRIAILVIAVLAALLPGGDPVTMLLMMFPILVLYEGSILLAALLERREARAREREEAEMGSELAPFDSRRLMLFDLRGSGRRRVVKIVYVTLAILMGGGLVLFGIGGSGALSGGLLDAITESSGGADDGTDRFRTLEQQAVGQGPPGPDRRDLGRRRPRPLQPRADGRVRRPGHRQLHGRRRRAAALRRPGLGREREARRRHAGPARGEPHGAGLRGHRRARQGRRARRRSSRRTGTRRAPTPRWPRSPTRRARPARGISPPTRRSSSPNRTCGRRSRASSTRPSRPRCSRRSRTRTQNAPQSSRDADSESRIGVTGRYNRSATPL